jgi:tetratricopeptide (TPR) repeat protein
MTRRFLLMSAVSAGATGAMAANKAIEEANKLVKAGKYEEAITALEGELKKNPKDAGVRKALAEAHYEYGEHTMYDNSLPPFRKYPTALRQFRKTVEYDPKNKKAQENIATIEGIYKSMGRPVPK